MEMNARYTSFVAVGDSFTEGMSEALPDGSYRGWADLLAARLAAAARPPSGAPTAPAFRYANLAVRGKLIGQITNERCGPAAAMGADLVTLVGGLNGRPAAQVRGGPGVHHFEDAAGQLAKGGGQLVLMRSPGRPRSGAGDVAGVRGALRICGSHANTWCHGQSDGSPAGPR